MLQQLACRENEMVQRHLLLGVSWQQDVTEIRHLRYLLQSDQLMHLNALRFLSLQHLTLKHVDRQWRKIWMDKTH